MKCIIADAGPIIALCKVDQLRLLNQLFDKCLITDSVYQEVTSGNDNAVNCLQLAVEQKLIRIKSVTEIKPDLEMLLDVGEASSITLAIKQKKCALLIDEVKGRHVAKQMNLQVIGLAGLLLLAKKKQLIDDVIPLLLDIRKNGYWLSNKFMLKIAKVSNEKFDDVN